MCGVVIEGLPLVIIIIIIIITQFIWVGSTGSQ